MTSIYEPSYPSGLYSVQLKAERRQDSPETVMGALDHNRQELELRRIEEVVGLQSGNPGSVFDRLYAIEMGSGLTPHPYVGASHYGLGDGIAISPDVNGNTTVSGHAQDATIHAKAANLLAFHSDPMDPNYAFVQWFLEEMELWDKLSAGGTITPSITEVMKALWQNKYNIEVAFDPIFVPDGVATGSSDYTTFMPQSDIVVWGGFDTDFMDGEPPIGAFCNLSGQPYPIMGLQDNGGVSMGGMLTLYSGVSYRAVTKPGWTPAAAADYVICLMQYPQHLGGLQPVPPPTGALPPPASGLPVPPGWDPTPLDLDVFGPAFLSLGPEYLLFADSDTKVLGVRPGGDQFYLPGSANNEGLKAIPGSTFRGIAMDDGVNQDWGVFNISLGPGEVAEIYATVTGGNAPATSSGLALYATLLAPANSGVMSWDGSPTWSVSGVAASTLSNEIVNVPMVRVYNPYTEAVGVQVMISNELFDAFMLMGMLKRTIGYVSV